MNNTILNPKKALNKAFLKIKTNRTEIEKFKSNLIELIDKINESESEEFHKNLVSDFLKNTYYGNSHYINTKGRNDLVIHNGNTPNTTVGVIVEAKKPTNKAEMIKKENINAKAFQELVLYYLRERITHKNLEIKYLIATNIYEWFIFDANLFEKQFAENKSLVKQFVDFEEGRLAGKNTDFFYKQIAESAIENIKHEINFTYFDIRDYQKPLRNNDKTDDNLLIALYKLLSPEHLLKLAFANDSNSLDKTFYTELLHIIGLVETKDGGKKLIQRKKEGERNAGSLLENTIVQLDSHDKISRIPKLSQYGSNSQEQLFNVALELVITWMNRILFLKLLEAQLLAYHKRNKDYMFLDSSKIRDFDDLDKLFFRVLAKKPADRDEAINKLFGLVPYLNSSLFEPTELEHQTLFVSGLEDFIPLPYISSSVIKDATGKRPSEILTSLDYLFSFLNAYDFASEGSEEIQEDNKQLINASVLGLIFEKINGYKDGSFFTPGFITMYMCRETIRRAVVQKFNETKGWNCEEFGQLYDKIEDRVEANSIVNSVKICDPAVGSGHFLVSALNEIISIKSELKILSDRHGKRLKEYDVQIENDELIITDDEGGIFEYKPTSKESQRIQETLFHEKQTIIENCLFGVDINPNSVKICRLRLWIELLKNAYYKNELELETLPNIDINIKCGNSLISRYPLDADIKTALKKSKWSIDSYRLAIMSYRNAANKEQKRELERLINTIKNDFETEVSTGDKRLLKLNKTKGELMTLTTQTTLFGRTKTEQTVWNKQVKSLTETINALELEITDIRNNKIYENAFEWRFEFPEVLNDEGDFVGFDAVIGNPPYMRVQEIQASQPKQKIYYETLYQNAKAAYDLANLFFELAINISNIKAHNSFIFPHKFFNSASSEVFRNYLMQGKFIDKIAHFGANMVFEDADTYTCIAWFSKHQNKGFAFQQFPFKSDFQNLMTKKENYSLMLYEMINKASQLYGSNQWIMFNSALGFNIFEKIYNKSKLFSDAFEGIFQGLATSKDDLYILEMIDQNSFKFKVPISGREYELERELFKHFLMGKDVQRYSYLTTNRFVFFPYKLINGKPEIVSIEEIKEKYPNTYQYVIDHEKTFRERESGKAGKMEHWHAYIYPKNLNKFEQPKLTSMEICANHPNVTLNYENLYHTTKAYSWVKKEETKESYEYLLSIANSKLLWWFLKTTGDTLQGDARTFKTNYLNPFPLPIFVGQEIESIISGKVKLVMEHKKLNSKSNTTVLEAEIDHLVYQLYELTEEEIGVIENSVK